MLNSESSLQAFLRRGDLRRFKVGSKEAQKHNGKAHVERTPKPNKWHEVKDLIMCPPTNIPQRESTSAGALNCGGKDRFESAVIEAMTSRDAADSLS